MFFLFYFNVTIITVNITSPFSFLQGRKGRDTGIEATVNTKSGPTDVTSLSFEIVSTQEG